jgi:WD40 repeat protein
MPGDDFIVSASRDRSIRIWEVASGFVYSLTLVSMIVSDTLHKVLCKDFPRPRGVGAVGDTHCRRALARQLLK